MNSPLLRYALLAGAVYFCCMALAHYLGIKQPVLFIDYDLPLYAYQDRIISFAVVAYIALFYSAAHMRAAVPAALIVLGVTVIGLGSINVSHALESVLVEGQSTRPYWIQTGLIAIYFLMLLVLYFRDKD